MGSRTPVNEVQAFHVQRALLFRSLSCFKSHLENSAPNFLPSKDIVVVVSIFS